VSLLFNGVEQFSDENDPLKKENQRLKDEVNRLKDEQGQPMIRTGKKDTDISSDQEHQKNQSPKNKKSKKNKHLIKAHCEEVCQIDISQRLSTCYSF